MNRLPASMEQASRLVGYASLKRYKTRGGFLFAGINLRGARVLEVGCGNGTWAIWAALHGAEEVTGIDPEANGSTADSLARFRRNVELLRLDGKVRVADSCLQDLRSEHPFDVIVMFNVINHLDEEAVAVLHHDAGAVDKYKALLTRLRGQVRTGGWVIVADCGRTNFWNQLGFQSPFARGGIEWSKHQNPGVWRRLFELSGFRYGDLRWSPLQPFPGLTSNWLAQYFTSSHFVLRVRAV